MTTTAFTPTPLAPFQWQPTLDGSQYNATVTWNIYGQRWYLNLTQPNGTLVVAEALVDTAPAVPLLTIAWVNGTVTATTSGGHGYLVGATAWLTIAGCAPSAYNGLILCYVTSPITFTFPLALNPGPVTTIGAVSVPISMTGGYFGSVLTFDYSSQSFTVLP